MAAEFLIKQDAPSRHFEFERGGSWLFAGSVILFLLALAVLGGMIFLNKAKVGEREQIAAQNQSKEENLRPELLNSVVALDRRLKNLRTLLGSHTYATNVFKVIEQDTHPQVRFTSFSFTADSQKVDLSGQTTSYSALARQIGILERDPQIAQVDFGGLSTAEEKFVGFKLSIILKQTLLSVRP